ncbi:MAG: hypothetical protein RIQ70_436, partial [Bacteroidota bacterium]
MRQFSKTKDSNGGLPIGHYQTNLLSHTFLTFLAEW